MAPLSPISQTSSLEQLTIADEYRENTHSASATNRDPPYPASATNIDPPFRPFSDVPALSEERMHSTLVHTMNAVIATDITYPNLPQEYEYLHIHFPQFGSWTELIRAGRRSQGINAAYRSFLHYRITTFICHALGLNRHTPSVSSCLVSYRGLEISISVHHIIHWGGRAPGTYANHKNSMERLTYAIWLYLVYVPQASSGPGSMLPTPLTTEQMEILHGLYTIPEDLPPLGQALPPGIDFTKAALVNFLQELNIPLDVAPH